MLTEYTPAYNNFVNKYANRTQQGGAQKGDTKAFKLALNNMTFNVNKWDIKISDIYEPGSVEYVKLFPNGHKPFITGKQFERVNAVKALQDAIGTDPALAVVKALVDAYYTVLFDTFDDKGVAQQTTGNTADALEQARIDVCNLQYKHLGELMGINYLNPIDTEKYFDLETIRVKQQTVFTKQLIHDTKALFFKRLMRSGQMLRITCNQNTRWFLSNTKDTFAGQMVEVLAGIPKEFSVNDFMVLLKTHRYLIGVNHSGSDVADVKVEILYPQKRLSSL